MTENTNEIVDAEVTTEPETTLTADEIIEAFEVVYEELVVLRNSVINLHERLQKLEPQPVEPTNVPSGE